MSSSPPTLLSSAHAEPCRGRAFRMLAALALTGVLLLSGLPASGSSGGGAVAPGASGRAADLNVTVLVDFGNGTFQWLPLATDVNNSSAALAVPLALASFGLDFTLADGNTTVQTIETAVSQAPPGPGWKVWLFNVSASAW